MDDRVLDLNKAFRLNLGGAFNGVKPSSNFDMLSFLGMGERGLIEADKALQEAGRFLKENRVTTLLENNIILDQQDVQLESPIPRPAKNIVCLGLNYADHVSEGAESRGSDLQLPEHPIFFTKPPTAVTGPFDDIVYPRSTCRLDYEVELAIIIGKEGKYISEDEVYDHVVGCTVLNDITARDLQSKHSQWYKGKSCDTFAPMGPYIVTMDEVGDPMSLDMWLKVNGTVRQKSNTSNMIFNIEKIVSVLSEGITLEPGDIIATGTPSGVGLSHPLGLLKVGDTVETWIENVGVIRNTVVAEK